jgi:hypothetical protein
LWCSGAVATSISDGILVKLAWIGGLQSQRRSVCRLIRPLVLVMSSITVFKENVHNNHVKFLDVIVSSIGSLWFA